MEKIEEKKRLVQKRLEEASKLKAFGKDSPVELRTYQELLKVMNELWGKGDPETRAKIIALLVHRIDVGKDVVKIHYQLGETNFIRGSANAGPRPFLRSDFDKLELSNLCGGFFVCEGSNTLTNGAAGGT